MKPSKPQIEKELRYRLYDDERIRKLVVKKQRHVFALSILILLIHFGFVSAMAFRPQWLAAHIENNKIDTLGLLISFILIVAIYGIMLVFARRKMIDNNSDVRDLVEIISNE